MYLRTILLVRSLRMSYTYHLNTILPCGKISCKEDTAIIQKQAKQNLYFLSPFDYKNGSNV